LSKTATKSQSPADPVFDPAELDRSLGFLLGQNLRLLATLWERRVKIGGLTRAQWRVLVHLLRHDGATQTELADLIGLDKAPLGRLIDRMERDGWLTRRADPLDRRVNRVHRTDKIDAVLPRLRAEGDALDAIIYEGISAPDRERLIDQLLQVKANLVRALADPGP